MAKIVFFINRQGISIVVFKFCVKFGFQLKFLLTCFSRTDNILGYAVRNYF